MPSILTVANPNISGSDERWSPARFRRLDKTTGGLGTNSRFRRFDPVAGMGRHYGNRAATNSPGQWLSHCQRNDFAGGVCSMRLGAARPLSALIGKAISSAQGGQLSVDLWQRPQRPGRRGRIKSPLSRPNCAGAVTEGRYAEVPHFRSGNRHLEFGLPCRGGRCLSPKRLAADGQDHAPLGARAPRREAAALGCEPAEGPYEATGRGRGRKGAKNEPD